MGQAPLEDCHQGVGDGGAGAPRVLVCPGQDALERGRGARGGEGQGARPEPVEQRAEGEHVRLGRRWLALHHLGRHVRRGADQRPGHRHPVTGVENPRDPEVHQLQDAVVADHHVLGFQVAVDDSCLVGVAERAGELLQHQGGQLRWKEPLALGEGLQGLAPHQLRHQEGVLGGGRVGEVEDLEDVGVLQPGDGPRLAGQTGTGILLTREVGVEDLDRHLTLQRRVHPAVDDGHASRAEWLEKPIAPQVPALEAHPCLAPPQPSNAQRPRNVPQCSGMAAQGAMSVSDGPGKRSIQPLPVRAFPASYAPPPRVQRPGPTNARMPSRAYSGRRRALT